MRFEASPVALIAFCNFIFHKLISIFIETVNLWLVELASHIKWKCKENFQISIQFVRGRDIVSLKAMLRQMPYNDYYQSYREWTENEKNTRNTTPSKWITNCKENTNVRLSMAVFVSFPKLFRLNRHWLLFYDIYISHPFSFGDDPTLVRRPLL